MPQHPIHLLCVEPRFPGRLGRVADWLVRRRGYRCQFYCHAVDSTEDQPAAVGNGLDVIRFNVGGVAREAAVSWTRCLERGLCYAYGCWEVVHARRPSPVDLVLGRSAGLGSTLFLPVSFPGAPLVNYLDYFFHAHAYDLAGEAGPNLPVGYYQWRRAANAMDLLDLENGVIPWAPTRWQRDLFPPEYREAFTVLHDGVDIPCFSRRANVTRNLQGRTIPAGARVVSFVTRRLDRIRGFDRFVDLVNRLLRWRPDVLCIVIGGSPVHRNLDIDYYNQDYRAEILQQQPLHDPERCWFLGEVPQTVVADLLAISTLHVYPSRPYIVARSLLEAMASGCVVLAWDSEPVREFISPGHNGLVVPPNDPDIAERQARAVLDDPGSYRLLGENAAALVRQCYARDVTLPALASLFDNLVERCR